MKYIYLIIIPFLFLNVVLSQELNINIGMNYSQTSGFEVLNPMIGIQNDHLNPYVGISISNLIQRNKTGLGLGVNLSSRNFDFPTENIPTPYQQIMYIELPISIKQQWTNRFYTELSIVNAFGILVDTKLSSDFASSAPYFYEIDLLLKLAYSITDRVSLNVSFLYGSLIDNDYTKTDSFRNVGVGLRYNILDFNTK